jgi:hypothetical protein
LIQASRTSSVSTTSDVTDGVLELGGVLATGSKLGLEGKSVLRRARRTGVGGVF